MSGAVWPVLSRKGRRGPVTLLCGRLQTQNVSPPPTRRSLGAALAMWQGHGLIQTLGCHGNAT